MTGRPDDILMQTWKGQLEGGLRIMETLIEGAIRIRETQLKAAADAHADVEATRKAIAGATDPYQVFTLQMQWAYANFEKCAAYWRSLQEIGTQTNAELAKCLGRQAPAAVAAVPEDASKKALLAMIDGVYKQWLDATQQMYKLPAIPAVGEPRRAAA